MEKKTLLYEKHLEAKGKIVPFGGYLLPVQYPTGVITEHMAVRKGCGMFDVSHMGEILLKGPGSTAFLNHLLTNEYTKMEDGQARYSPMCNESGGVVDDLIVYKVKENSYFLLQRAGWTKAVGSASGKWKGRGIDSVRPWRKRYPAAGGGNAALRS